MKELKLKSFDFAADLTKQLITLATILIGISITFFEKFDNNLNKWVIVCSWIFLLLSIILGLLTSMALTGTLGQIDNEDSLKSVNIYNKNIRLLSSTQIIVFVLGIFLLITYSSFCVGKKDEIKIKTELIKEKDCNIIKK
jgi:hypothetical protein